MDPRSSPRRRRSAHARAVSSPTERTGNGPWAAVARDTVASADSRPRGDGGDRRPGAAGGHPRRGVSSPSSGNLRRPRLIGGDPRSARARQDWLGRPLGPGPRQSPSGQMTSVPDVGRAGEHARGTAPPPAGHPVRNRWSVSVAGSGTTATTGSALRSPPGTDHHRQGRKSSAQCGRRGGLRRGVRVALPGSTDEVRGLRGSEQPNALLIEELGLLKVPVHPRSTAEIGRASGS